MLWSRPLVVKFSSDLWLERKTRGFATGIATSLSSEPSDSVLSAANLRFGNGQSMISSLVHMGGMLTGGHRQPECTAEVLARKNSIFTQGDFNFAFGISQALSSAKQRESEYRNRAGRGTCAGKQPLNLMGVSSS